MDADTNAQLIQMTSEVVAAYVSNNPVQASDLPNVIERVHATIRDLSVGSPAEAPKDISPAVSVRKSITPDYLVCLEDGKRFKSLKRHLRSKYNLSPEEYREKWGLPADYPMVAPNYAKQRSELAKQMGLGQSKA
ncbi:MAG: transcriptional regulator [Hyphomonadaceae bacterium TMED5]|nr:transcriptional regulator [Ponticaulis sp.]OUX99954.1 MAG: transcriptional regulator [Hyphomonadaceae bacterium TMED5]